MIVCVHNLFIRSFYEILQLNKIEANNIVPYSSKIKPEHVCNWSAEMEWNGAARALPPLRCIRWRVATHSRCGTAEFSRSDYLGPRLPRHACKEEPGFRSAKKKTARDSYDD